MRARKRALLTAGLLCLSSAVVAGPAVAHGDRGSHGKHGGKAKIAKASKVGKNLLKLEVRGSVTAIDGASVTVSAGATLAPWTCAIPAGSTTTNVAVGDRVRLNCRSADGVLTATKLKKRDRGDRVKVSTRGAITALAADSVTVSPGGTLPAVTCAITARTRQSGTLAVGTETKLSCKSKNGVLVAKRLAQNVAQNGEKPMGNETETKGAISAVSATSITVGTVTCAVPTTLNVSTFTVGNIVEIKCTGTPLTLIRIHLEDESTPKKA